MIYKLWFYFHDLRIVMTTIDQLHGGLWVIINNKLKTNKVKWKSWVHLSKTIVSKITRDFSLQRIVEALPNLDSRADLVTDRTFLLC